MHSIAFGSEAIGDDVLGSVSAFTTELLSFKQSIATFKIPVTTSEDWNRKVLQSGSRLNADGSALMSATDLVHAHSEFVWRVICTR